jgi:hypothetical protein
VASAAERSLQRYGARGLAHFGTLLDTATPCGRALLELVQQRNATVRMRVLALLVGAAARSGEAALLLKQSGGRPGKPLGPARVRPLPAIHSPSPRRLSPLP